MPAEIDALLLVRYAAARDEAAFAELVRRRIDGVYSFTLRRVGGDTHLAEDVTQQVFLALAKQAAALARHPDFTGWLYTTARHHAANAVRGERRRKAREEKADLMPDPFSPDEIEWQRVAPLLDAALDQLPPADRTAILLRFVERRAFAEIGAALHASEDAARMRVDRALDKLRAWIEGRGIASTSAALATVLGAQAVAAPATLAATVTSAALVGSAMTFGSIFIMTKFKMGVAAALIVAGAATFREIKASDALDDEIRRRQAVPNVAAALASTRGRIDTALQTAGTNNGDAAELAQLRHRIAQLKARPLSVLDAAMKPVSQLTPQGWSTAQAAYETQLWARTHGHADQFVPAFGWTAQGKVKIDRFFATLPESVRARYGSPERMLAPGVEWGGIGRLEALQIFDQTSYGDSVQIHAWGRFANGRELSMDMLLKNHDGVWRIPITDEQVDRWIAEFDPVTGERRPRK